MASANTPAGDWSATQYLKFKDERTRAVRELLARIPLSSPRHVVDLGCGPGNSSAVLAERFPDAQIAGVDSSPDMIAKAKANQPGIAFTVGDLQSYEPRGPVDLFFSNAALQWLPGPALLPVLRKLVGSLPAGGVLAFQVPDNLAEPCHVAMRETAEVPGSSWEKVLREAAPKRDGLPSVNEFYDALRSQGAEVDVWRTTYHHIMEDHQAIVDWFKGSGLIPFLEPLTEDQEREFVAHYLDRIKEAYSVQVDGKILLRFPRLFVVAVKV